MRKLLLLIAAVAAAAGCLCAQRAQGQGSGDLAGTWFGSIVLTTPDGKATHDTAVLTIHRSASDFGGGMGRTIDQLTPWANGSFKDNQLRFHLDAAGGLDFVLTYQEGTLAGAATGQGVQAQIDLKPSPGLLPHEQLLQEIMTADKSLYEAFDGCDVALYGNFLSKDLEFYHDRTGKTGYEENLKAVENRCAEGIQLRRELETDSLIVNAVPGLGAIEAGTHRFYSKDKDGQEHLDATARFTNVWSKESGHWKLVRVISYDHR